MTAKKSYFKKVIIGLFVVILICIGGFYIYASDYYHAKDYEVSNVDIKQQDNYTVYGDTNSKTGFIFYPGAWLGCKGCSACNCDRPDPCFCILSVEAVPDRGACRKKEGRQMETSCRTLREADLSWITDGISKPCDRHWRYDRADCGKQLRRCIYRRLYGDVQALWYP